MKLLDIKAAVLLIYGRISIEMDPICLRLSECSVWGRNASAVGWHWKTLRGDWSSRFTTGRSPTGHSRSSSAAFTRAAARLSADQGRSSDFIFTFTVSAFFLSAHLLHCTDHSRSCTEVILITGLRNTPPVSDLSALNFGLKCW